MNAKQLKDIRFRLRLTQIELAKRLGVSWRTIAGYETGAKIPQVVQMAMREVVRQETN